MSKLDYIVWIIFYLVVIGGIIALASSGCGPSIALKKTVPQKTQELILEREEHPFVVGPDGTLVSRTVDKRIHIGITKPVVIRKSIWSRWWWWLILSGAFVFIFGWAPLAYMAKRARELGHSLCQVVQNIAEFKREASLNSQRDNTEALKMKLETQDAVTRKEVQKAKTKTQA